MARNKQRELNLDELESGAVQESQKTAKALKQEKALAKKELAQQKVEAAKAEKAAQQEVKREGSKKQPATKLAKPVKPAKLAVKGNKLGVMLGVAGIVLMMVGTLSCITTVRLLANKEEITPVEATTLSDLRKSVDSLKTQLEALPTDNADLIEAVNREIRASDSVQDRIKSIAEQSGMIVHKTSMLEKKNEAGKLKAYYVLEGAAQTNNIVQFLKQMREQDNVMLFDEVSLLDGTRVSVGLNTEQSSETTLVKEFRIVLQHVYDTSSLENPPATKSPNTATPQEVIPEAVPTHTHSFENSGWKQAPTEVDAGYKVDLCTTCNEVNMVTIPASAEYHAWTPGPCGGRTCTICNKVEEKDPAHFMGPWSDITDSTCYVAGAKECKCITPGCEFRQTAIIEKKPHKYITQDGKQVCQVCGMPQTADLGIVVE